MEQLKLAADGVSPCVRIFLQSLLDMSLACRPLDAQPGLLIRKVDLSQVSGRARDLTQREAA